MNYLTQKFGPLPGYAWLILGVGLFLAYRVWKGQGATSTTATTATGTGFLAPDAQTGVVSALQAAIAGLAFNLASAGQNTGAGATGAPASSAPSDQAGLLNLQNQVLYNSAWQQWMNTNLAGSTTNVAANYLRSQGAQAANAPAVPAFVAPAKVTTLIGA